MDSSQSGPKKYSLLTFQEIYLLAGDVLKCCSCSRQVRAHQSISVLLPSPPVAWTLLLYHKRLLRWASPQRDRIVMTLEDYVMHWLAVRDEVHHYCWMPVDAGCSWHQGATREGQDENYPHHTACTLQHLRRVVVVETSLKLSHWPEGGAHKASFQSKIRISTKWYMLVLLWSEGLLGCQTLT